MNPYKCTCGTDPIQCESNYLLYLEKQKLVESKPTLGAQTGTGDKDDSSKPPMELLSHEALLEITKVFDYGQKKYGRFNYRNGINYSRIVGAAHRHLGAFNSGQDTDPETGLSHIAHLGCCAIMLLDMIRDHANLDDRYKPKK